MPSLTELASYLESIAPAQTAENWDNVGVLVRCAQETGVLCALDITPPR
ncbi:MAG: Nif3-like dinuclear metal center hexameric protein [Ruthenibacterium lactatiformans]